MSGTRILQMTNPGAGLDNPTDVVDTAFYAWWQSQGWELVDPDADPLPTPTRFIRASELEAELATRDATSLTVVEHGDDEDASRPVGAATVYWIGSVEPANGLATDLWHDTSVDA